MLLEEPQQLDLDRGRNLADLVEKQGPAIGEREPAILAIRGTGERAALVTEQLALEERLGERGAVQLDEWTLRAGRSLVQRVRDQLLAGATLAGDQHGRSARRDLIDDLEDALHRWRDAHDVVGRDARFDAGAELASLAPQMLRFEDAVDHE